MRRLWLLVGICLVPAITVNIQPVAFGRYQFVARAVAGSLKSENSAPSPAWDRVPGKPENLRIE